jgi:hypothetical protein
MSSVYSGYKKKKKKKGKEIQDNELDKITYLITFELFLFFVKVGVATPGIADLVVVVCFVICCSLVFAPFFKWYTLWSLNSR